MIQLMWWFLGAHYSKWLQSLREEHIAVPEAKLINFATYINWFFNEIPLCYSNLQEQRVSGAVIMVVLLLVLAEFLVTWQRSFKFII
jgi:hypothetical protein